MKPALLERSAIGPIDRFEGEFRCTGERVLVYEQSVVHAVELDGSAERRIDDPGVAFDRGRDTADAIEAIERPYNFQRARLGAQEAGHERGGHGEDAAVRHT